MNATATEQRRSSRFRQSVDVDLIDKRGARRGRAIDIARHGLFVAIVDPPHNRHLVQLVLHLPDGPLQAAATVSRTLAGQGVGLQLFALSSEAKRRWDAFIAYTQHRLDAPPQQTAGASQPSTPAPTSFDLSALSSTPAFVVKLKTMERLRDYLQSHVAAGGTVLFTPVLPVAGTRVQLLVVHPLTEAEFPLVGRVHRAVTDAPKRLEILFEHTDMIAFARFVDSGLAPAGAAPAPVAMPAPTTSSSSVAMPAPTTSSSPSSSPSRAQEERELDFDISDADDTSLEDDPIDWDLRTSDLPIVMGKRVGTEPPRPASSPDLSVIRGFADDEDTITRKQSRDDEQTALAGTGDVLSSDELVIEDAVPAADPGLRPLTMRLSCERQRHYDEHGGGVCDAEAYTVEVGPCTGVLGLVADLTPFWSPASERVVSVPRLLPPEERRARFQRYLERNGHIDDIVSVSTFLAAADLAEAPRHPITAEPLRTSRAIERLTSAAQRAVQSSATTATKVRCPHCTGQLLIEKA